MALNEESM